MKKELEQLKTVLQENKDIWIPTNRFHDTGIGKTFEDLLGKKEDNFSLPDLGEIEVKTQRTDTSSLITLFTKSPNGGIKNLLNEIRRETFHATLTVNVPYPLADNMYLLMSANNPLSCSLMLGNDFSNFDNALPLITLNWDIDSLKKGFSKIRSVAYIRANRKYIDGVEHFKYTELSLLYGVSFEKFLRCINNGTIKIDFRIGQYKSGKRIGMIHDHGTGFRISKKNLPKLYEKVVLIK